ARCAGARALPRGAARRVRGRHAHARDAAARRRSAAVKRALWLLLLAARAAAAQDFAGAAPPGSTRAPEGLLDKALPSATAAFAAAAAQTEWWDVPGLETRAIAVSGSHRAWRAALGLSQTGDPDLGWTALALGFGASNARAGAALRALTR